MSVVDALEKVGIVAVAEYRLFADHVGAGPGLRARLKAAGWNDYRYDFALPDYKLLIESQGSGYGHSHRHQQHRDYKKNNDALKLGWRVMYFPSAMIGKYPQAVVDDILDVTGRAE